MRKTTAFRRQACVLVVISLMSASGCTNSSNSNADGVWYKNKPTPAPSAVVEPTVAAAPSPQPSPINSPSPLISPSPAIIPSPSPTIPPSADEPPAQANPPAVAVSSEKLMIPVVGVKREDLRDTFKDARSEGRVHDAIDIMAAGGTPVVAATNGKIVKFFDSVKGGITIYQLSPDERTVYYYAHLQRRADDLREGETVAQGRLLGYVGDTGNAGAGNTHLHFAVWTITNPKSYFEGVNINPYPLLKDGIIKSQ